MKTPKEMFDEHAREEWLKGASFSSPPDSLNRIPFVIHPAVFKLMKEYAKQWVDHCERNSFMPKIVAENIKRQVDEHS